MDVCSFFARWLLTVVVRLTWPYCILARISFFFYAVLKTPKYLVRFANTPRLSGGFDQIEIDATRGARQRRKMVNTRTEYGVEFQYLRATHCSRCQKRNQYKYLLTKPSGIAICSLWDTRTRTNTHTADTTRSTRGAYMGDIHLKPWQTLD